MKYTKENLGKAIQESLTWNRACTLLGVKGRTGSQTYLKKKAIELNIDFSHFTGQAWAKGKASGKRKDALELCKKDTFISSHKLKNLLIRDGYKKAECEICKLKEWGGEPIVLELDHINSDHIDNRVENLQVLCPNCHAQLTRNRRKVPMLKR